jgi:hypothetical protein
MTILTGTIEGNVGVEPGSSNLIYGLPGGKPGALGVYGNDPIPQLAVGVYDVIMLAFLANGCILGLDLEMLVEPAGDGFIKGFAKDGSTGPTTKGPGSLNAFDPVPTQAVLVGEVHILKPCTVILQATNPNPELQDFIYAPYYQGVGTTTWVVALKSDV